ncbi:hypothetical protein [Neobacillus sp. LXY-4]|uniref:hypothetical protein n=1 Tax=Neobacillus sp. LXY-4 TaxID=3379826 RepID=UPI003EE0824D
MKLFMLHRKVPAQANGSKDKKAQELIRKVPPRIKFMTLLTISENVKHKYRKQPITLGVLAKQETQLSTLIRIQMEEVKRKVRVRSPEAKQFIGPGDLYTKLLLKEGGKIEDISLK